MVINCSFDRKVHFILLLFLVTFFFLFASLNCEVYKQVHFLNEEQLAARQVETIDIASAATDYWSYAIGSNTFDFSKFKSAKTGRGPLLDGWQVGTFSAAVIMSYIHI